jgi:hypothetical protein
MEIFWRSLFYHINIDPICPKLSHIALVYGKRKSIGNRAFPCVKEEENEMEF